MRIKRLNIDFWMERNEINPKTGRRKDRQFEACFEIEPVIGKPGFYLLGDKCWFESSNGRAFSYNKTVFLRTLNSLNVTQKYNQKQIRAMEQCIFEGVSAGWQREIVYIWNTNLKLNRTIWDFRVQRKKAEENKSAMKF